jgi:hypothetical protein
VIAGLEAADQSIQQLLRFVQLGFRPAAGDIDSDDVGMSLAGGFASDRIIAAGGYERACHHYKYGLHDFYERLGDCVDDCASAGIASARITSRRIASAGIASPGIELAATRLNSASTCLSSSSS